MLPVGMKPNGTDVGMKSDPESLTSRFASVICLIKSPLIASLYDPSPPMITILWTRGAAVPSTCAYKKGPKKTIIERRQQQTNKTNKNKKSTHRFLVLLL